MGRPSDYCQETADAICERLMEGESLRQICNGEDMPHRVTVSRWLAANEVFRIQYAIAREEQAETLSDELVEISDGDGGEDSAVKAARDRLRVDTRKWVASKLKPKKYGERQVLAGDPDAPLTGVSDEQLDARINALLAKEVG